ncbi:MAG: acyltransferase [Holosporaceae bacterium]|jgi:peptidoglycan/LPS O-acetylase OafA/YrhL|nr:acyltransferase [Holosporaceae bacterium]
MSSKTWFSNDIERLRGFACIPVLVQHLAWICPMPFIYDLLPSWLLFGTGGVHIFFAISGFVVTMSLKDKFESGGGGVFLERLASLSKVIVSFYKRRFFRVFPVMVFSLILVGMFLGFTEKDASWAPALWRAPLEIMSGVYQNSVEAFVGQERIHMGGVAPFWTLSVDILFYTIWPILLLMCRSNNARAIMALLLGLFFMLVVYPVSFVLVGKKYYLIQNNVAELLLGSFFAFVCDKTSREFNRIVSMMVATVLCLAVWVYPSLMANSHFANVVLNLASVGVVALAVFREGSFDIPVLNRIFDYLGSRSFSFYSVQLILANIVVWYTDSIYFPRETISSSNFHLCQFSIFILLLMAVTELVHRYIEKPARRLGR